MKKETIMNNEKLTSNLERAAGRVAAEENHRTVDV